MTYHEYWNEIHGLQAELHQFLVSYWNDYSNAGTWQFWTILFLLVLPLIILYFAVDRSRIFELFFFGFVVHMLWTYSDAALSRMNFLTHTYFLSPYFYFTFSVTASLLPTGFLLLYQYCTNHHKNFYLYTIGLSFIFAFIFLTFEEYLGLVDMHNGMRKLYVFFIDIAIAYAAYWFTKFVLKLRKNRSPE